MLRFDEVMDGESGEFVFERGRVTKRKMIGCLDRQYKTHIGGTFLGMGGW